MKGKKALALLTCTALLAASLTACGNTASTTAPSAQEPQESNAAPETDMRHKHPLLLMKLQQTTPLPVP